MVVKLIACEIAVREFSWAISQARNVVFPEFLPQGYHDNVETGRRVIQDCIDAAEETPAEAVILGYALCSNIAAGLRARTKPLVLLRAHDCITWFLGSKERYAAEFEEHPGCYYYTAGWLNVHRSSSQGGPQAASRGWRDRGDPAAAGGTGAIISGTYEEIVEKYGEDNAQYLWEMANAWITHYTHGVYVRFPFTDHLDCRERVHAICAQNGWEYAEREGDPELFLRWIDGPWDREQFLVVEPGRSIVPTFDGRIITIAKE